MTGSGYTDANTVYVSSLRRFFNNKFIIKRLASIEMLKIIGLDEAILDCRATFDKLTHLELRSVRLATPTILQCPNLKILLMSDTYVSGTGRSLFERLFGRKMRNESHMKRLGLCNLKSKLQHFRTTDILYEDDEIKFFNDLHKSGALSELETLDCHLHDFRTLQYISKTFDGLKSVNVRYIPFSVGSFLMPFWLDEMLSKLRPNLKVFLFGIPFNKQTIRMLESFLSGYGRYMEVKPLSFGIKMCCYWNHFSRTFIDHLDLFDGFFKLIDKVTYGGQVEDKSILNQLVHVSHIVNEFESGVNHDLSNILASNPNIKELHLCSLPGRGYPNDILDLIPLYCPRLIELNMDNWETNVNYKFLLNLPLLKVVKIHMRFPFQQAFFMTLLRTLTKLTFLEIWCEKPDTVTEEEIEAFKLSAEDFVSNELKYNDCTIKVEIHNRSRVIRNEKFSILRILMKRTMRDSVYNSMETSAVVVKEMVNCIAYMRRMSEP